MASAIKIRHIAVYPYKIPLLNNFTTAHGALATRDGAIVEIITNDGITGIGEIAPMPAFAGGTLDDALSALRQLLLTDKLPGKNLAEGLLYLYTLAHTLPPTLCYGLETALLDALGQQQQRSIVHLLTPSSIVPRASIRVNAVIGSTTTDIAVQRAQDAVAAGFRCIKLKVGQHAETDIERITAVREAIGPATHLRLDANEAWDLAQARTILTRCAHLAIQYVEQPLNARNIAGMHQLRQLVSLPLAADEAVHDLASARRILTAGAADILIVKPQLAGGLRVSQQIIEEAAAYAVQCVITTTIEAGIGTISALHLAAATPAVTLECGLATLSMLADDLLLDDLAIHDGIFKVPTNPGLGVHLDRQALAKYTDHSRGCL